MENSNRSSLFFAILAIVLILGGVFYLNQQITNSREDDSTDTSVATQVDTEVDSINDAFETRPIGQDDGSLDTDTSNDFRSPFDSDDDFGSNLPDVQEDEQVDNDIEESEPTITDEPLVDPDEESETSSSSVDDEDTVEASTELSTNQVTLETLSTTSQLSSFRVVECGIENASACAPGASISLSGINNFNIQQGETYLVTADISESGGRITIRNIQSMQLVN